MLVLLQKKRLVALPQLQIPVRVIIMRCMIRTITNKIIRIYKAAPQRWRSNAAEPLFWLNDISYAVEQENPEGKGQGTEKGRGSAHTARQDALVPHLLCHDIARRGRDASQHDEESDQLFVPKPEPDCGRQENRRQNHQLDEGRHDGGFEIAQSFFPLEACADGKQCQWTCQAGNAGKGLAGDGRHGQPEQGIHKAKRNADQDGIGEDAFDADFELIAYAGVCVGRGAFQRQNEDGEDVVERNTAKDHQTGHAGSAVNVLDERCAEDGSRGTVARLHELADDVLVPKKQLCQKPDDKDAYKSRDEAEQDIFAVKVGVDVGGGKVSEELNGQGDLKNEFIGGCYKAILKEALAVEQVAQQHDKKERHGAVQTENKIVHQIPPLRWVSADSSRCKAALRWSSRRSLLYLK